MHGWEFLILAFVIAVYGTWRIRRENRAAVHGEMSGTGASPEAQEEESEEPNEWTDPELLAEMRTAKSFDELLDIVKDVNSYDFSDEEDAAFLTRARELGLTGEQWAEILEAVRGEDSVIEEIAEESAGKSAPA